MSSRFKTLTDIVLTVVFVAIAIALLSFTVDLEDKTTAWLCVVLIAAYVFLTVVSAWIYAQNAGDRDDR